MVFEILDIYTDSVEREGIKFDECMSAGGIWCKSTRDYSNYAIRQLCYDSTHYIYFIAQNPYGTILLRNKKRGD